MSLDNRKSLEPWILDSVEYYGHQVDGIRTLANRRSFILADEMGLGKSLQALTIFAIDVKRGWCETCIIVCPVTLKSNWADEIEKFTRFRYVVLDGDALTRAKQLLEYAELEEPKILIVNYEQVRIHLAALNKLSFDIAIFDEAHYMKNHRAARTKACISLYSRRSFLLTGTPLLNHVNELWTLLHRIDPGAYPKYWSFVNHYCVFGGFKDKQIVGVKNERELNDRVQSVMMRRLKKDVLDLPEVQIIERRVDLYAAQRELYDEVENELKLTRFDSASPDDIENALTKFLRLKQICGTTWTFTDEDNSSKLDVATLDDLEILENGHKTVVFTQFRDMQSCYSRRMKKFDIPIFELNGDVPPSDRPNTVKQWAMTKEPGVLVCMLQVAGIGLNMTAARHGAFLDKLFVPGLNNQAIDRLHRIGQDTTQPVQFRDYITRNTIESRIQQILRTKMKIFGEIIETDPNWKRKLIEAIMAKDEDAA